MLLCDHLSNVGFWTTLFVTHGLQIHVLDSARDLLFDQLQLPLLHHLFFVAVGLADELIVLRLAPLLRNESTHGEPVRGLLNGLVVVENAATILSLDRHHLREGVKHRLIQIVL